jgi:hypothetical protein
LIIGGSSDRQEKVNLIDVLILPCKVVNPGDCEVLYNGVLTSTINTNEIASEYFRDYKLEVYMIEANQDIKNYEKPLSKNMGQQIFRFNAKKIAFFKTKLSKIASETVSGTFSRNKSQEEGLFLRSQGLFMNNRNPASLLVLSYNGVNNPPERFPYALV